jgi:hypothetical protein
MEKLPKIQILERTNKEVVETSKLTVTKKGKQNKNVRNKVTKFNAT